MTDFNKLMLLVGVLSVIMGVISIVGGSPTPGVFFVLMGLLAGGGTIAGRSSMADEIGQDFDKMVGAAGFAAAGGIGLAWLGMAGVAFNNSRMGGADGFADQQLWWGIIAGLLSIAALGALFGGLIHFRQKRG